MTWYWPLLPLLVSGPASALACTPLPLHTSVTPGLAPQGSGYLSVKQAELLSRAPGHCPIDRGCQCGGRQRSTPSFYISRRRKEPESHPRKPIWGCSLVRFSQPGWQASGWLGSRFYLNLTHLSLTFWARWTTQEHNMFQPWGSASGKLSASPGVLLTAATHVQPSSLPWPVWTWRGDNGPVHVLHAFLFSLQQLYPSSVTCSPRMSAARRQPCRSLMGPQCRQQRFLTRGKQSPPNWLQPALIPAQPLGRSSSKTGRECCRLCTPAVLTPREPEDGLLLSSICILTFQQLVWGGVAARAKHLGFWL